MESSISGANHSVLHAQNDRWGLGPIVTINSGHNVAVVNEQNHRWGLEPIETCNSEAKVAVLNAKNHRWGLGPLETSNSDANYAVLHAKVTNEDRDPYRLLILMLKALFWVHQTTDEGWDW